MRSVSLILFAAFLASIPLGAGAESTEQAQIDFANGLLQRGFYKEAVAEYKTYLEKFPQGEHVKVAQYRLGEAACAAKDYESALDAFDKVLASGPDPDTLQRATLSRAETLYFLKRPADSAIALEPLSAEGIPPQLRARALYYLGKINSDSGNTDAALKNFKTLAEAIPDSPLTPYARYQLAFVYAARGELEAAATAFSDLAGSNAPPEFRAESRFRAAETYDKLGWFDAAVKAYEQLRTEFPDSAYSQRADYGYTWALYHAGRYAEAAAGADAFLKKNPDSPHTVGMQYLVGNCLQQQQKLEEAIAQYRAILAAHADSEFAGRSHYKLAWCLYLSGKLDEARDEISTYLQSPTDEGLVGDSAFLLGSIMVAKGDYEGAQEEFRLVAEKYPQSEFGAEALFKAGECLAQLGRTDEAAKTFETFATRYPDSPLTEQAVLRAGDAQFFSSSFEAAIEKYKKILEAPADPSIERDTLYRLAITYHNMKNYEASASTFGTLVQKYPDDPHAAEAQMRIGDFYLRESKDPVKAIEAYEASLKIDPQGASAGPSLKGLALARYETKDYDAASELFLRLMNEFPNLTLNEDTYAWVGQRLYDQQKWEASAAAFGALLKAKPDYPNPERLKFKVAECSEAAGKPDDAINLYKAVVEAAPASGSASEARFRMAKLLETKNKVDDAFALYEEVANTNTGDTAARARFRLGELYEAKKDYDAAARSYMRVAILFLHEQLSPESLWRAGQCFEKAGSTDQARKAYEELLKDYATTEQAPKAQQALAGLG